MKSRTVLFVDDENHILATLEMGLANEPYQCLFADSSAKALDILSKHNVHVIVTDLRMPDMSGLELLKMVREQYPDVVRLVLSAYMQISTLLTVINQGHVFKFIPKPWSLEDDFKPSIRAALEYYDQQQNSKNADAQLFLNKDSGIENEVDQ